MPTGAEYVTGSEPQAARGRRAKARCFMIPIVDPMALERCSRRRGKTGRARLSQEQCGISDLNAPREAPGAFPSELRTPTSVASTEPCTIRSVMSIDEQWEQPSLIGTKVAARYQVVEQIEPLHVYGA